jgi:CBS domain-containing protein
MAVTIHYLSELVNKPVRDPSGHVVGRIGDLIVRLGGPYPPITGLTLKLGLPGRGASSWSTFLHWGQVASVNAEGITLSSARLDLQAFRRRKGELLVEADLLDQQVMDLDGHKLVRVNDVQLVAAGKGGADLRLAGIDVGVAGLLRRLAMAGIVGWLANHNVLINDRVIPWDSVEPVDWSELPGEEEPPRPGGGRGLQLTHEKLAALHPADVAEIVAQLSGPERISVLESLEPEQAAEALGEMEPDMQGDVLEDMPTKAALEILAELPADEAADALAEVSVERAAELLRGLEPEESRQVRKLMSYPQDVAGGMMNTAFIALDKSMTAQETIDELRQIKPPAEEAYYVYVIDKDQVLQGVLSLRDLIIAEPTITLAKIIEDQEELVSVTVETPGDEVVQTIDKYNLLAVPVTDEADHLVGVITIDDALATVVPSPEERRYVLGSRA